MGTLCRMGQTKTVTYILLVGKKIMTELFRLNMTTNDGVQNSQAAISEMPSRSLEQLFEQRGLIRLNFDLEPDNESTLR